MDEYGEKDSAVTVERFRSVMAIVVLDTNGANVEYWLEDVNTAAAASDAHKFLQDPRLARSRELGERDYEDNGNFGVVKKEAIEHSGSSSSSSDSSSSFSSSQKDKAHVVDSSPTKYGTYVEQSSVDMKNLNRKMMRGLRVFFDAEGDDEDKTDARLRMKLYASIVKSLIHHRSKIALCQKGNVYQIVCEIMSNFVLRTSTSICRLHAELANIKFLPEWRISDLARSISDLVERGGALEDGGFHPEVVKGRILECIQQRNGFALAFAEFSKPTYSGDFDMLIKDLSIFEANHRLQGSGRAGTTPSAAFHASSVEHAKMEVASAAAEHKELAKRDISGEICHRFQKGQCRGCQRQHIRMPKPQSTEDRLCYNCQTVCGNIAANCSKPTAPKPARVSRSTPKPQSVAAAASEGGLRSMLAMLTQMAEANSDSSREGVPESANMMREVGPPPGDREEADAQARRDRNKQRGPAEFRGVRGFRADDFEDRVHCELCTCRPCRCRYCPKCLLQPVCCTCRCSCGALQIEDCQCGWGQWCDLQCDDPSTCFVCEWFSEETWARIRWAIFEEDVDFNFDQSLGVCRRPGRHLPSEYWQCANVRGPDPHEVFPGVAPLNHDLAELWHEFRLHYPHCVNCRLRAPRALIDGAARPASIVALASAAKACIAHRERVAAAARAEADDDPAGPEAAHMVTERGKSSSAFSCRTSTQSPLVALIDSACSSHYLVLGDEKLLLDRASDIKADTTQIETADAASPMMKSLGRVDGTVKLKGGGAVGTLRLTKAVLLAPGSLTERLFSVGELTKLSYALIFMGQDGLIFDREGALVAWVKRTHHNLYPLSLISKRDSVPSQEFTSEQKSLAKMILAKMAELRKSSFSQERAAAASEGKVPPPASTVLLSALPISLSKGLAVSSSELCLSVHDINRPGSLAAMARIFKGEAANLKQVLHDRFGHASLHPTTKLYKACSELWGAVFTKAPAYNCKHCYINKVHRIPHPRRTAAEKQERSGPGPHGFIYMDTFAWPYPGEHGERYMTLLYNQRTVIGVYSAHKSETPALVEIALVKMLEAQREGPPEVEAAVEVCTRVYAMDADEDVSTLDWGSMKLLISDNAAEFFGSEMTSMFKRVGVPRLGTGVGTPAQNESENAGKFVVQGIATLQHQSGLPRKYWVRAAKCFMKAHARLPNMCPLGAYSTPYEVMHQTHIPWAKLEKSLHPYGCRVTVLVPKGLRAHTHAVDKGLLGSYLGDANGRMGCAVLTDNGVVLEGVHDVFFDYTVFPHAVVRDRRIAEDQRKSGGLGAADDTPALAEKLPTEVQEWLSQDPTLLSEALPIEAERVATAPVEESTVMAIPKLPEIEESLPLPPMPSLETPALTALDQAFARAMEGSQQSLQLQPEVIALPERRSLRIKPTASRRLLESLAELPPSPPDEVIEVVEHTEAEQASMMINLSQRATEAVSERALSAMSARQLVGFCDQKGARKELFELSKAPTTRGRALKRPDAEAWVGRRESSAESRHVEKLRNLKVFQYEVPGPDDVVMSGLWVYALKLRSHEGSDGRSVDDKECSARYTANGSTQKEGYDYGETHCPTPQLASIWIDEARAAQDDTIVREIWDWVGAFYQTKNLRRQFVRPPPGYERRDSLGRPMMWLLLQCMPGTKDASHNFNLDVTGCLTGPVGMSLNEADKATFHLWESPRRWVNAKLHVDDAVIHGKPQALVNKVFEAIEKVYPMKRGLLNRFLGIEVVRTERGLEYSQPGLIADILQLSQITPSGKAKTPFPASFSGFTEEHLVSKDGPLSRLRPELDKYPYANLIGQLAYCDRCTVRSVKFELATLRRFVANYGPMHIEMLEHLVDYVAQHAHVPMIFPGGYSLPMNTVAAADCSYACCKITSTSHEMILVWFLGCVIHATSQRQKIIAGSSMLSEFMGAHSVMKVLKHFNRLMSGFGIVMDKPVPTLEDNQSAIFLSRKPNLNGGRTRHYHIRWHELQHAVRILGLMELKYINTFWQPCDPGSKQGDRVMRDRLLPLSTGHLAIQSVPAIVEAVFAPSGLVAPVVMAHELETREEWERASMMREGRPDLAEDAGSMAKVLLGVDGSSAHGLMSKVLPALEPGSVEYTRAEADLEDAVNKALRELTEDLAKVSLKHTPRQEEKVLARRPAKSAARSAQISVGISLLKSGNLAWSPADTNLMRSGRQDHILGLGGSATKAFTGGNKKLHTLSCRYVLCAKGALKGLAFHGGVRVVAEHVGEEKGYVLALCCHPRKSL
jgi:hypothetical protein